MSGKKEIVVATKNAGKVKEIAGYFAELPVRVRSLAECGDYPDVIEDGTTFEENAIKKATEYAKATGCFCLADDSGLEVDALNQAPGVYSARYAGEQATDLENNKKLLKNLQDVPPEKRTARFRCALVLADPNGKVLLTESGTCEGIILETGRGSDGFGYDPLMFIPRLNKTLAEISMEEKNQISHRGQALRNLTKKLPEIFQ